MVIIGNLIKCPNCKRELQPEDILIGADGEDLISRCGFCGEEISKI